MYIIITLYVSHTHSVGRSHHTIDRYAYAIKHFFLSVECHLTLSSKTHNSWQRLETPDQLRNLVLRPEIQKIYLDMWYDESVGPSAIIRNRVGLRFLLTQFGLVLNEKERRIEKIDWLAVRRGEEEEEEGGERRRRRSSSVGGGKAGRKRRREEVKRRIKVQEEDEAAEDTEQVQGSNKKKKIMKEFPK